jgi:protein O-GlcNAc transferase
VTEKQSFSELMAKASQYHQTGQLPNAETLYREIIKEFPGQPEPLHLLGVCCSQQGRYEEAAGFIHQALVINPHPMFFNNLGETYKRQGEFEKAIQFFREAIKTAPNFAEPYFNIANVFLAQGNNNEAAINYQQALRINPSHARACFNLGKILIVSGDYVQALNYFKKAAGINPNDAEIFSNMALCYSKAENWEEVVKCYQKTIALNPAIPTNYYNLAKAYEFQAEIEKARECYHKVSRFEPQNLLLQLYQETLSPPVFFSSGEIDRYQENLSLTIDRFKEFDLNTNLNSLHESGVRIPLALVYQGRDDRVLRERFASLFKNFPEAVSQIKNEKPHIGFVVTEGHEGIFASSMKGIINNFSREKFQLTVICPESGGKEIISKAITNPAVSYIFLPAKFDLMAETIGNANFDLLYFWEIGTDVTNYLLPFCRLAPVQVTSWGWQVTSGIAQVDYYISSDLVEPPEADDYYSENLLRLKSLPVYYFRPPFPKTFQPRDYYGFSKDQHIYLCPQNLRKINPEFDILTLEILQRDPKAVYVLIEDNNPFVTNLLKKRFLETHPGFSDRIRFFPRRMSGPDYINLVKIADVLLDTLFYGGVNTSYDGIATGTPVITFPSRLQRGRYTSGIYKKMEITDCIADSNEKYIELALKTGTNPEYRQEISSKIIERSALIYKDFNSVTELSDLFEKLIYKSRE